ncbi:MAG: metallophosphoesterase [Cytophagales bacterium]|nr:metallophosphoesterase [Armatimonadota bacterium]
MENQNSPSPVVPRRTVLMGGVGALATAALGGSAARAALPAAPFSFVHITDPHIQPERGATLGVSKAFAAIGALKEKPVFGLVGGDIVMDAAAVSSERADLVYGLWKQEAAKLKLPLHYSVGNHDVYGLEAAGKNAAAAQDPDFGKNIWKRRLGLERTYGSFDHQGWRFVTLDSVRVTPGGEWSGLLDSAQITWLDDLLRKTPRTMPMVFLTHIPLLTVFGQYSDRTTAALSNRTVVENGRQFQEMIQNRNVKAVFQGHTHVVEEVNYLGTHYITGGAVSGDWWKGRRLGVHPEGFVVATVSGDSLAWRYVAYGWNAAAYAPSPGA